MNPTLFRRVLRTATTASRALSSDAAHRLVQQRVQGRVALLQPVSAAPAARVVFVAAGTSATDLQQSLPFAVSPHALREFRARPRETLLLHASDDDERLADARVLLVGLGAAEKVDAELLRGATHGALSALRAKKTKSALLEVPMLKGVNLPSARVVELVSQVRFAWLLTEEPRVCVGMGGWIWTEDERY